MAKKHKVPSLTFVVIVYNSESLIRNTLERLVAAIERAEWHSADILVVDDGSTDKTPAIVKDIAKSAPVKITLHRQKNLGRLQASINGTKKATGDLVSFIGGRVYMQVDSLVYLKKQLLSHPERRVWNCHIDIPRQGNIQAQFWYVVTYAVWYRYLRKPRLLSYNIDDFDYYPKGTGGFVCPRDILLGNYQKLESIYDDPQYASDDTTLIRHISEQERIYMSPKYAADYIARSSFLKFIRHTYDRGVFLLDSYMRPGTRLFIPILMYFILSIPAVILTIIYPWLLLCGLGLLALTYIALVLFKLRADDALGFCILAPLFALVYSLGLWKGLIILFLGKAKKLRVSR
jgi:glycosyltransferase involved in cell wall biosynthesis